MIHTSDEMGKITAACEAMKQHIKEKPVLMIVLGSGLGQLADTVSDAISVPYSEISGFPDVTVPGHVGRLVFGRWEQLPVVVMQGRFHYYEGHQMADVVRPIRVMRRLGVERLLLTNAAGGLDEDMKPGQLMLISDHLGFNCEPPLRGENLDTFGPRFADQSQVYDRDWRNQAKQCAEKNGIPVREGIYCYSKGPQFETPAEIRALRVLGANAVGMSTVPEAIVASHAGMKVMGISCITNMAAGILDQPLSHDEVMEVGAQAADRTIALLSSIVNALH